MLYLKRLTSYLLMVSLLMILCSCKWEETPPTYEEIEKIFQRDQEKIRIVLKYLEDSAYSNICIEKADGKMTSGRKVIPIEDTEVNEAISYLLLRRDYEAICKHKFTMEFRVWSGILVHLCCGMTYTTRSRMLPEVPYIDEIEGLSAPQWYYYTAR